MARIVEKPLGRSPKSRRALASRSMTSAQGKRVKASLVDADSSSLGEDLLGSFTRSVERVRRENKLMFGHRDRVDDEQT